MATAKDRTRLAVLGSPIRHSRSPAIHSAAYAALGLGWDYEAIEQREDTVTAFLDERDVSWRGFSVTAPLKQRVRAWAHRVDAASALTGASNTLLLETREAWNTDVDGTVAAFASAGVDAADDGLIVGAGATAMSTLVSLQRLGSRRITIALRDPAKARGLIQLGDRLGVEVLLADLASPLPRAELVVSTLPATADVVPRFTAAPLAILDADYAGGVSRYAAEFGDLVISGVEMLVEQALLQLRIFVNGDVRAALDDEGRLLELMREAADGDRSAPFGAHAV